MTWKKVSLGSVASIFNGKTPSKSEKRPIGKPILKIKDVGANSEFRGTFDSFVDDDFYASHSSKSIELSDTLILNAAHNASYVGSKSFKACSSVVGVIPTGEWLVVRPKSDVLNPKFAHYWITSPSTKFSMGLMVKGIHLYPKDVARLEIPLPPLEEQRRIAAILDKADAIRRKREQAIALTDDLLRSTFLDMFGDPVTNPKGWDMGKISDLVVSASGGWSAKGEASTANSSEFGVLKISAITSGTYRPIENKVVKDLDPSRHLVIPQVGDLLFSRANTRELVAATCIVDEFHSNLFLPDKLWRLNLNSSNATAPFLNSVLKEGSYRKELCKKASGTSGSMLNISKAKLFDHSIYLPPLALQRQFQVTYNHLTQLQKRQQEQLATSKALFQSLSQRAFKGELTAKDLEAA